MSILDRILETDSPALVRHCKLESTGGPALPVAAAVYSGTTLEQRYRICERAPIFDLDDEGFLYRDTGRIGRSVVISSVAAEATRAEAAIYLDPEMHVWLPGIEVHAPSDETLASVVKGAFQSRKNDAKGLDTPEVHAALKEILATWRTSSWETAHRHVDAVIRYSVDPETGRQAIATPGSDLYRQLVSSDPATIARLSLNSLIWGYWLASGAAVTHRRPRSISTHITGFDAEPVYVHATKAAGALPASSNSKLAMESGELVMASKGKKPSVYGLGSVISAEGTSPVHFVCGSIVQQTSVALTDFRALGRQGMAPELVRACLGVAIMATEQAASDLHLRSECDLLEVSTPVWGLRRRGERKSEPLEVTLSEVRAATLAALQSALKQGHLPADRQGHLQKTTLCLSEPLAQVTLEARLEAMAKGDKGASE